MDACRAAGVPVVVNDRIDVALAAGAAGVHVGQDDLPAAAARQLLGPGPVLGVSVKTIEQAVRAQADGADYLGAGAGMEPAFSLRNYLRLSARLLEVLMFRSCAVWHVVAVPSRIHAIRQASESGT